MNSIEDISILATFRVWSLRSIYNDGEGLRNLGRHVHEMIWVSPPCSIKKMIWVCRLHTDVPRVWHHNKDGLSSGEKRLTVNEDNK